LEAFQRVLGVALNKAVIEGDTTKSRYTPHMTLLYDDSLVMERPVETMAWTVREFVLVRSLLGQTVHVPLARWPLLP
jgi:2'-5' RNA ligase